jgi:hypothetical protein
MSRLRLIAVAAALLIAGCTESEKHTDAPEPLFSVDENRRIKTRDGETLLLRGVNARVLGLFDSATVGEEKRPAWVHAPDFTADDARRMREYGLNFLRLPINWSGLEPERGTYNEAFIERIREIVELCAAEGIYVLIDFHQDGFSKWVGQDGAPLWAVRPAPKPGKTDYDTHASPEAVAAHDAFYANEDNLQDSFADAVLHVDRAFRDHPYVVGIQILNEPIAGLSHDRLLPFYERVVDRVNPENPERIWFFEPSAVRNQTDKMPLATGRFPAKNAIYAPHIYTSVFSPASNTLEASFANAEKEAESFGAGLCSGEYGGGDFEWHRKHADLQNKYLAHSAIWVWKEFESWGFYSASGTVTEPTWTPKNDYIEAATVPFPQLVEGELDAFGVDRDLKKASAAIRLRGEGRIAWGVPPSWYPEGAKATCDGAPATVVSNIEGRLVVTCPLATRTASLAE